MKQHGSEEQTTPTPVLYPLLQLANQSLQAQSKQFWKGSSLGWNLAESVALPLWIQGKWGLKEEKARTVLNNGCLFPCQISGGAPFKGSRTVPAFFSFHLYI